MQTESPVNVSLFETPMQQLTVFHELNPMWVNRTREDLAAPLSRFHLCISFKQEFVTKAAGSKKRYHYSQWLTTLP